MAAGAPKDIRYLETLQVFGVRADYMSHFRQILQDEGVSVDRRIVPVPIEIRGPEVPLQLPRVARSMAADDPKTAFRRKGPMLVLRPPRKAETRAGRRGTPRPRSIRDRIDRYLELRRPLVDWYPKIRALRSTDEDPSGLTCESDEHNPFRPEHLTHLDFDGLYFDLQRLKSERGWANLTVSRSLLPVILAGRNPDDGGSSDLRPDWYQLRIPRREMEFADGGSIRRWQDIASAILNKYATRYYSAARMAWEARHLEYRTLDRNDPLYPRVAESRVGYGYSVQVKSDDPAGGDDMFHQITAWAEDKTGREPPGLLSLDFDRHLYTPLLQATNKNVVITPTGLNKGEYAFVEDLRQFCDKHVELLQNVTIHLARNPSRGHGIHFFEANNFHPDFILWAVESDLQRIAFIDPKGLVHESPDSPKVLLCRTIKDTEEKLSDRAVREGQGDPKIHLDSFIVSVTPRAKLEKSWGHRDPKFFSERHVVFQEDGSDIYIRRILEGMGVLSPVDEAPQQLPLEDAG